MGTIWSFGNAIGEYRDLTASGNKMRLIALPWTDADNERLKAFVLRARPSFAPPPHLIAQ
jgi:hypothetical protein